MTDAERNLMERHVAYWTELAKTGVAVVFGPVADPKGPWGLGVVEVNDEADVHALIAKDPTVRSGTNFKFEVYPMPTAILRGTEPYDVIA